MLRDFRSLASLDNALDASSLASSEVVGEENHGVAILHPDEATGSQETATDVLIDLGELGLCIVLYKNAIASLAVEKFLSAAHGDSRAVVGERYRSRGVGDKGEFIEFLHARFTIIIEDVRNIGFQTLRLAVLEIEHHVLTYALHAHQALQAAVAAESLIEVLLAEGEGHRDGVPPMEEVATYGDVAFLTVILLQVCARTCVEPKRCLCTGSESHNGHQSNKVKSLHLDSF